MEVALADLAKPCNQPATPGKSSKPFKHSTGNNEKSSSLPPGSGPVGIDESILVSKPEPRTDIDLMPLAEGLPEEFAEYLKGAIAYHRNQFPVAREAWKKLLKLPPSKRHYRSTWALYMLGRMQVDRAPAEAIQSFQTLRKGVDEGFSDTLGLAAASLGWEARAAFNLKQYDRAIELYLEQWAAGQDEPSAHQSIERVIQAALKDEDADLLPLAEMEASRTMVTLF